ncbi:glycosyltransferase [Corallococcus llansteffanensis]|uniref:Glycosyltransferase n=1 Tax=Corallococcus llansteffanensis TaxID=2316731 RepID=A0A3A8PTG8_9BACT|nr:glycosyltransferase [Corallococcus llansteffanensis]RKH57015.1 glycosyltransferase [Corallococcus llansteffanensis]
MSHAPGKTFLMTAPAMAGHVMPMLALAQALTRRGHRVLFHASSTFADAITAAGATCVPYGRYRDALTRKPDRKPPGWLPPLARGLWRANIVLRESIPELVEELEAVIHREPVHALVADFSATGARYAAERTGCPFVTVSPNLVGALNARGAFLLQPAPLLQHLPERVGFAVMDALHPLRSMRERMGLPPRAQAQAEFLHLGASDTLHLVLAPRQLFPAGGLRQAQEFPGLMSFEPPSPEAPDRTAEEALEPGTVVVSTTTAQGWDHGMLDRTLRGVARLGNPVLATTAASTVIPEGLGAHVRCVRFLPHDRVFPRAAALVAHGGWGTVGKALRHGLPMLIISRVNDQPLTGRRLEELGLAYHLPFSRATPEAVQERVSALLQDEPLRRRLKALAEELAGSEPAAHAARLVEGVAR